MNKRRMLRDVDLVDRMEDKIAMITLTMTMAYKGGVNYSDTMGTVAIWDSLIHRYLLQQNIIVPPNEDSFKSDYEGGYVKDPHCGIHDWVCSFDINSLYPNIIVQWNMSPETIAKGKIEPNVTVDGILNGYTTNSQYSVAATGQCFDKSKQGFMPKIIEEMYDERTVIKKKMLASKQELERCDKNNKVEVTYTGDGTGSRAISHSLTSTPGCIILKRTDAADDWYVVHRSASSFSGYGVLNTTAAFTTTGSEFHLLAQHLSPLVLTTTAVVQHGWRMCLPTTQAASACLGRTM